MEQLVNFFPILLWEVDKRLLRYGFFQSGIIPRCIYVLVDIKEYTGMFVGLTKKDMLFVYINRSLYLYVFITEKNCNINSASESKIEKQYSI